MKKRYKYKPTIYKIGNSIFKKMSEDQYISIKNKNGFTVTLNFKDDSKPDNNVINEINDILLKTIFK